MYHYNDARHVVVLTTPNHTYTSAMLETTKNYISKFTNAITPNRNTLIGASQVATVIVGALVGQEAARYLADTDVLPDNAIGEILSGSSDYVSERTFRYFLTGSGTAAGFITASWLGGFKEHDASAGVDLSDLDVEEDLNYFNIESEGDPSPKELRDLIQRYQSMRDEFNKMRIALSRYQSQDEDILMKMKDSDLQIRVKEDAEASAVVSQLVDYAEHLQQNNTPELPNGIEVVDDGIVISRNGEKAKQTFDELLASVMAGRELSSGKSNLADLDSEEFYADDAANLYETIAVAESIDAADKFAEGDDRATIEQARENVAENLEQAMKS